MKKTHEEAFQLTKLKLNCDIEVDDEEDEDSVEDEIEIVKECKDIPSDIFKDIDFHDWKKHSWKFIPVLYKLQKIFHIAGVRSFKVIPMMSFKQKPIILTNTGLSQFIMRNTRGPNKVAEIKQIMLNPRATWKKLFKIDMFESDSVDLDGLPVVRFNSLSTDGIIARICMTRPKRSLVENTKSNLKDFDFVVGVDPGVKEIIGGVIQDLQNPEKEKGFLVSSAEWRDKSGFYYRKQKLTQFTGRVENEIADQRESLQNIGQSSPDFKTFTRFELQHFNTKCEAYMRNKIMRMSFDKYITEQKAASDYAKRLCQDGKKTIVFFGSWEMNQNSAIKG